MYREYKETFREFIYKNLIIKINMYYFRTMFVLFCNNLQHVHIPSVKLFKTKRRMESMNHVNK
jgi:hypothetical protein